MQVGRDMLSGFRVQYFFRVSLLPYKARQLKTPIATTVSGGALFNPRVKRFDLSGCESRDNIFPFGLLPNGRGDKFFRGQIVSWSKNIC